MKKLYAFLKDHLIGILVAVVVLIGCLITESWLKLLLIWIIVLVINFLLKRSKK